MGNTKRLRSTNSALRSRRVQVNTDQKKVQKSDLQAGTVGIGSYRILYGMSRVKRAISRAEKSIDKPLLRTIPIRRRRASLACRTVRSARIAKSIRLQILSSTA